MKLLKSWLPALAILCCGASGFAVAAWAEGAPKARHVKLIKVSARRFVFSPANITLKKGEAVDLELKTEDVLMGFSVPDLNTRADIVPGQVVHVRLKPDKAGTFPFLCDIFCGSGHENMNGMITVAE